MKTNGCNPYLPSWEYVPDGEPRVFGGRVYVYGSHDRFGGPLLAGNMCRTANPVCSAAGYMYMVPTTASAGRCSA